MQNKIDWKQWTDRSLWCTNKVNFVPNERVHHVAVANARHTQTDWVRLLNALQHAQCHSSVAHQQCATDLRQQRRVRAAYSVHEPTPELFELHYLPS